LVGALPSRLESPRSGPLAAWLPSALLVLSVPQAPLFSENQTTKFLHGAASAGYGQLGADWTANTLDPLPLFSAFARALFAVHATWLAYPIFAGLLAVYGVALLRIARRHFPALQDPRAFLIFWALFLFLNKTTRPFSMETGLAGQYLLGSYLQPCAFGALLLLGLERGLAGRFVHASAALSVATAMHPTYVPAAGLLFAALAALAWRRGLARRALVAGGLTFLPVLAALLTYYPCVFRPTDPASWQQSVAILTRQRIPHHTQVRNWLDATNALRITVMLAGIVLIRRHPLAWILGALFAPMAISIALLSFVSPDSVALTTPWRLSVVVMPVSSTLLVAAVASRLAKASAGVGASALARNLAVAAIAGLVVWGAVQQVRLVRRHHANPEMDVMAFVRTRAGTGQLYLVPPFEGRFNPFRLHTGVPIVANWKTHPYKDTEVLEWHRRVAGAQEFYESSGDAACRSLDRLRDEYRVTHAVVPGSGRQGCRGWLPVYRKPQYLVLAHAP
jgi:hypothetical protein